MNLPHVVDVVERLTAALEPADVVLGGGNVNKLQKLPPGCHASDNANAFIGGRFPGQAALGHALRIRRPFGEIREMRNGA
jgi:hypothetical protein